MDPSVVPVSFFYFIFFSFRLEHKHRADHCREGSKLFCSCGWSHKPQISDGQKPYSGTVSSRCSKADKGFVGQNSVRLCQSNTASDRQVWLSFLCSEITLIGFFPASLMAQVYDEHKDEDGFLYITFGNENYFGWAQLSGTDRAQSCIYFRINIPLAAKCSSCT